MKREVRLRRPPVMRTLKEWKSPRAWSALLFSFTVTRQDNIRYINQLPPCGQIVHSFKQNILVAMTKLHSHHAKRSPAIYVGNHLQ